MILLNLIHRRTESQLTLCKLEPITKENYQLYVDLWFKCAEQIRNEFRAENLFETATAVKEIIETQYQYGEPTGVSFYNEGYMNRIRLGGFDSTKPVSWKLGWNTANQELSKVK